MQFPTRDAIPEAMKIDADAVSRRWLCDGEVRVWQGPSAEVRSPVCVRGDDGALERALVGHEPMLDAPTALEALAAASRAWGEGRGEWPSMRVAGRIQAMERFVVGMRAAREEVVRLLMWEIAKTRKDAESEFDRTVQYVVDTIEAVKDLDRTAARFVMEEGFLGQIRRSPLGVVLCMGPFNYPLNETFTTLVPALIMGNTVVSKLPRHGGLSHVPLFRAMAECFPKGVVNVFQGDGATTIGPLMQSGEVDVLAFIGTSRVANILKRQHPKPNRLRCILGLEAKNPAVILPDADLDVAVRECTSGALSYNGQRCTAIKLVLVHKDVADDFVKRLSDAVDALKGGMPWEPGAQLTPLPEPNKAERLQALVDDAVSKGARVVNAGGAHEGTWYRPAVVYPVRPGMALWSEEQFGPIVPVASFESDGEIDHFMRESPYGQQVALFGRDRRRLGAMVDALVNQVCRINLNSQCRRGPDTFPFNGRKDSAEGTLSVSDALRAFSIRTVVAAAATADNKGLVTDIVTGRMSRFLSTDFLF
ncbi:MAG: NADP-dependent glyceraldehyde-3-phosphate dehydrogenase [Deltaproteobacteria bacterium]|nr:NADP-dependent glyceraldehyde-3-phosphate dehydrogenase [Deltaproteobacteria bacterium]